MFRDNKLASFPLNKFPGVLVSKLVRLSDSKLASFPSNKFANMLVSSLFGSQVISLCAHLIFGLWAGGANWLEIGYSL